MTIQRTAAAGVASASDSDLGRLRADLHDGLGQELFVISLLLEAVAKRPPNTRVALARELNYLSGLTRHALQTLRRLASGTIELEKASLADSLRRLARTLSRTTGLPVRFMSRGLSTCAFGARTSSQLYRIAQEAAANAVKHSRAARVTIQLVAVRQGTRLTIIDDGRGLGPPRDRGWGLQSMQARAASVGGVLTVEPRKGGGTRVTCAVPKRSQTEG